MRPRTSRRDPDYPGITWRLSWDSPKYLVAYPFRFLQNTVLFNTLPFVTAKYWRTSTSRPRTGEWQSRRCCIHRWNMVRILRRETRDQVWWFIRYSSPQGTEAGGLAGDLSQVQAQPRLHSNIQPKLHSKTLSEKQTNKTKQEPKEDSNGNTTTTG